jgi:pre-mRNA-splicing factor CWC22
MELFSENLIRGRGLLARSLLKAQASSILFTPVFASLVSVINSKLPIIGEIILKKLVLQFRRSYRRNDKGLCLASVTFLAHLVNQQVAHEILPLQLLTLLLERSTDDSVEIAIGFLRECGMSLSESSPKLMNILFERFRHLLVKGNMDVRVQWMIQVLFQTRRDKFKDFPSLKPELDLVEEEDRVTHYITLDDEIKLDEDGLLVFRYDATFEENEAKYAAIKEEIIGDVELAEQLEESAEEETTKDNESSTTAQGKRKSTTLLFCLLMYFFSFGSASNKRSNQHKPHPSSKDHLFDGHVQLGI